MFIFDSGDSGDTTSESVLSNDLTLRREWDRLNDDLMSSFEGDGVAACDVGAVLESRTRF